MRSNGTPLRKFNETDGLVNYYSLLNRFGDIFIIALTLMIGLRHRRAIAAYTD